MRLIFAPDSIRYVRKSWIDRILAITTTFIDRKMYYNVKRAFIRFYSIPINIEVSLSEDELLKLKEQCELAIKDLSEQK